MADVWDQFKDAPTDGAVLLGKAKSDYPYLANSGLVAVSGKNGGNRKLEYWPRGEPGNAQYPRPAGIPIDSAGVEIFDQNVSPKDLLADYVSHEAVNSDPQLRALYQEFAASVPDETMRKRYDYHKANLGENRDYETWKEHSGMPEFFRGYTFDQWPDAKKFYSPQQIQKLDKVREYLGVTQQNAGGDPWAQFKDAEAQPPQALPSLGQQLKRQLGLTARVPIDVIASLPLAAADAGIATRNLLTGSNYDSASKMYDEAMASVFPKPETGIEKGVNIAGQMVVGSRLPSPQAAQQAPANFSRQTMRQMAAAKAAERGYVVPPSTVNQSTTNKVLESIAGKVATEQDASLRNQTVTDRLVKRAIGMAEDETLSPASLEGIRQQAGKVYEAIKQTPDVKVDQKYLSQIAGLPKSIADEISPKIMARVDSAAGGAMRRGYEPMPASQIIQRIRELRFESQRNLSPLAAVNPESAKLGKAQKAAAAALENLLMRNLRANGAGELADEFASARELIAKTHSVEKAMNPVTGEINAAKLAQQLAKGKPLTGDLRDVAEFATAFPKASKLVLDSGSVRNTDVILGAGTAALAREPTYLLYPFARQATRNALLSEAGQRVLTTPGLQPHPSLAMSMLYGIEGARKNALAD